MRYTDTPKEMMEVHVAPHDPEWRCRFETEASRICQCLERVLVRIHHIGSTAIPGIDAKPIIDILMDVVDLETLDEATPALERLGYEAMGEYGIPERRYFRRHDASGRRTHHVHAFRAGSTEIERHLAFRDYMIEHPGIAQAYGELKQRLAHEHSDDIGAYVDGKDAFVKEHEKKALLWWKQQSGWAV